MENIRGAVLMSAAMAAFAVEDALIKALSSALPTGQVLLFLSIGGAAAFAALMRARGLAVLTRGWTSPPLVLRSLCELVGGVSFVLAITLGDLSTSTAILQAVPLAVVAGAALVLGETVGWRRWTAVGVGFAGVLVVIRPGMAAFDPASLLAVVTVAGLAARDLATRRVPVAVPSLLLSTSAYTAMIPGALFVLWVQGQPLEMPAPLHLAGLVAMLAVGMTGYVFIVAATRIGEMSVIAPFRFSRILFALAIAAALFGERPDAATYLGAALIVGSAVYAIWRERAARRRAASLAPQGTL